MKKTQGKAVINSLNKPIEHNPPGKDVSNRIARALGKAADMASSNKARKVSIHNHNSCIHNLPFLLRIIVVILKSLPEVAWMSYICRALSLCCTSVCRFFQIEYSAQTSQTRHCFLMS